MVEYIDRYVFYMSYQNCYVLFNIRTTLSTRFKTEKSCTRSENHHFRTDVSAFTGSPYMMSRQTIQKSPDTPDKSGEICFGLVKYFNFFLINMFKFLQKYKNVW